MSDEATVTENDVNDLEDRVAELEAELAEKEAALAAAEELVAEYRPTADVELYLMEDADDVKARFSEQHLRDIAEKSLADINKTRLKNGFMPINYNKAEWEKAIDDAVQDLLQDRARTQPPVAGRLMRTLKMITPGGNLIQIPYEDQVNNLAGSIADAHEKYKAKGFKLPSPMLCPTMDCYNLSAVDEAGNYAYKAYCTQDHLNRTEGSQGRAVSDAIVRGARG